jgi:hypothetical protein
LSNLNQAESDREKKLNLFDRLIKIIRGQEDFKNKVKLILEPDMPQTSTKLNPNQIDFVSTSIFIADYFDEMKPLRDYAIEFCRTSESNGGWGVDKVIQLEQAIGEKRMLQLGLKPQESKGSRIKEAIKGNETKQ